MVVLMGQLVRLPCYRALCQVCVHHKRNIKQALNQQKLKPKNPSKVGVRQMFLKDLMGVSNEFKRAERVQQVAKRQKVVMKKHNQLFEKLSTRQLRGYELHAAIKRSSSRKELQEKKECVRERLEGLKSSIEESAQQRQP